MQYLQQTILFLSLFLVSINAKVLCDFGRCDMTALFGTAFDIKCFDTIGVVDTLLLSYRGIKKEFTDFSFVGVFPIVTPFDEIQASVKGNNCLYNVSMTGTVLNIFNPTEQDLLNYQATLETGLANNNKTEIYSSYTNYLFTIRHLEDRDEVNSTLHYENVEKIVNATASVVNATIPDTDDDFLIISSALTIANQNSTYKKYVLDTIGALSDHVVGATADVSPQSSEAFIDILFSHLNSTESTGDELINMLKSLSARYSEYYAKKNTEYIYDITGNFIYTKFDNFTSNYLKLNSSIGDIDIDSSAISSVLNNPDTVLNVVAINSTFRNTTDYKVSNMVDISVLTKNGSKGYETSKISNLSNNVTFSIPLIGNYNSTTVIPAGYLLDKQTACIWHDPLSNSWSSEGCTVLEQTATNITCTCNHLTLFAIEFKDVLTPEPLKLEDIFNETTNYIVLAGVLSILLGIWIIGGLLSYTYDRFRKDSGRVSPLMKTRLYELSITASNLGMKGIYSIEINGKELNEHFTIHLDLPPGSCISKNVRGLDVGPIKCISVNKIINDDENENVNAVGNVSTMTLSGSSKTFSKIELVDIHHQLRYIFDPSEERISTLSFTYPPIKRVIIPPTVEILNMSYFTRLRLELSLKMYDRHLWLSIVCRPRSCAYTSLDRFLVGFMWITITAACGLAWFNVYKPNVIIRFAQKIIVALIASAIAFTAVFPTEYVLRRAAVKPGGEGMKFIYRVLAYIIIIIVSLGCICICSFYALKLDQHGLLMSWFQSFLFSVFETIFISQPLLVIIISSISVGIKHKKIAKEINNENRGNTNNPGNLSKDNSGIILNTAYLEDEGLDSFDEGTVSSAGGYQTPKTHIPSYHSRSNSSQVSVRSPLALHPDTHSRQESIVDIPDEASDKLLDSL